jgi:hypothetical protein
MTVQLRLSDSSAIDMALSGWSSVIRMTLSTDFAALQSGTPDA